MESSQNPIAPDGDSSKDSQTQQKPTIMYDSTELFGDQNEIMIVHRSEIYKIRITRSGRLIMNK